MKIPASKTVHFQLPSLQLLKKVPGLKKDFEFFKKDGSVSIKDFEVLKKHQGLFGKHQGLFATFSASCIFFNVRTHRNTHTVA